ncbi:MAG: glycosyltransferase family 4 protein [Actinomycetota bacterium]|nr:glycosyltransferase family 4 protein [Actinomycetota bacterium]
MRILLVNKFWKPVGGVEEHAFVVKAWLESLGHQVIPFAMQDDDNLPSPCARFFPSPVEFRGGGAGGKARAALRATLGIETTRQLRRLLAEVPVDAVHVLHAYHQLGTTFLRLLKERGIPTIVSLHDYKIGCPSYRLFSDATEEICTICLDRPSGFLWAPAVTRCWDGSRSGGAMLTAEALVARFARTYRAAGAVIVLNELQRRAVTRAGVDPARIHKVPHFIDVDSYPSPRREPYALYVGRLVPEKGVGDAIRACGEVGARLRVLGDGRLRPELEALAAAVGADVEFAGQVPQQQVIEEMRRAAVLLVPSVWHEVSALVITQAIAAHLPVVATGTGGTPDLIGDGRGFLYSPGDVTELARLVSSVLADGGLGRRAATRAAEYARTDLTEARWAERLRAVYAAVGVTL